MAWGFDLRLRRSTASIGPKWFTQRRTISSDTKIPPLSQQILDLTEAQGEPGIKPDRLLNDFGREAVAAIADLIIDSYG
jgi:hypothetical protein